MFDYAPPLSRLNIKQDLHSRYITLFTFPSCWKFSTLFPANQETFLPFGTISTLFPASQDKSITVSEVCLSNGITILSRAIGAGASSSSDKTELDWRSNPTKS